MNPDQVGGNNATDVGSSREILSRSSRDSSEECQISQSRNQTTTKLGLLRILVNCLIITGVFLVTIGFWYFHEVTRKEDTTMRNLERQVETLELSNRALQKQLQDAKRHKGSLERHISDLKDNDMELRTQLENSEIKRTELEAGVNVWKMENDKLQLRLAEQMGIDDSEENDRFARMEPDSPIQIAEQFRETYDNKYTDAFDELEASDMELETEKIIKLLLDILELANDLCRNYLTNHLKSIKEGITKLKVPVSYEREKQTSTQDLATMTIDYEPSTKELKQILAIRKKSAYKMQPEVIKVLTDVIMKVFDINASDQPHMVIYIQKCLKLCLLMNMHKHPIFIKFVKQSDKTLFDIETFKPYLNTGKYLDYVIWPPIYLYDGGHLLGKGIAEGKE